MRGILTIAAAALAAAFLFACAPGPARPPTAQPPARASSRQLTPEEARQVERLYYKAVGAYSRNDMAAASAYLKQILSLSPSHKPSLDLADKIRLATAR